MLQTMQTACLWSGFCSRSLSVTWLVTEFDPHRPSMPSNSDSQPPPRPAGGSMVSLYANLLDPSSASSPASISRAPVVFQPPSADNAQQDEASAKKQQISAGTLLLYPF